MPLSSTHLPVPFLEVLVKDFYVQHWFQQKFQAAYLHDYPYGLVVVDS